MEFIKKCYEVTGRECPYNCPEQHNCERLYTYGNPSCNHCKDYGHPFPKLKSLDTDIEKWCKENNIHRPDNNYKSGSETVVPENWTVHYPNGESHTWDREHYNFWNGCPRGTVRVVNRHDRTGDHYYDAGGNELHQKVYDGIVRRGLGV